MLGESGFTYDDEISVPNPTAEGVVQTTASDPVLEVTVHYAAFEQGPCEQDGHEQHGSRNVKERNGPQTEQLKQVRWRNIARLVQDVDGQKHTDNGRKSDRPNPGAYG